MRAIRFRLGMAEMSSIPKSLWTAKTGEERPLPEIEDFCDDSVSGEEIRKALEEVDEQIRPFTTPVALKALMVELD